MSKNGSSSDDRHLHTLERWKRLELEQAQAEHLACQAIERERQGECDRVQEIIASTQSFARDQCDSGAALSVETLLLVTRYSRAQQRVLADAEQALAKSREAVEQAHSEVVVRSEHLFGIEKLRDRRLEQRTQDEARKEQHRLDEGALLKLNGEAATHKRNF